MSSARFAKGDESTIDYFKIPENANASDEAVKIKIPTLPDAWTNLNSKNPVKVEKPKPTDEFKPGDVVQVGGLGEVSAMSDHEPITRSQSELLTFFESSNDPSDPVKLEDFSSKDKSTLTYIFGGVVAWWLITGVLSSKEDKKEH